MGLAERRLVTAAQEQEFKPFEAKVKEICGFDVKLTFDWAALENNSQCQWICENKKVSSYIFERVTDALKSVCADDMGKTAARERLKEIQMFPAAGDPEFANGILTVRNDVTGNGAYDAAQIQAVIEKGL